MTDTEAPYQTLQRVLVRMYFDPEFVSRVYACPSAALAGLDVSPRHVSQILATDRRAWQADRLRRRRALKVLMDEFKVTSALVLAASRSLGQLEFFFSSDEFHASVQSRGYMALAYRSYLRRLCQSAPFDGIELSAALTLEGGMAGARRARREAKAGRAPSHDGPETAKAGHYYCCAPGVACLRLPAGTLALVAHLEGHLFELSLTPALALCDDAPRPEPLPAIAPDSASDYLLEAKDADQVDFNAVDGDYGAVLRDCSGPTSRRALQTTLALRGVTPSRLTEMLEALTRAGVLERFERRPGGRLRRRGAR